MQKLSVLQLLGVVAEMMHGSHQIYIMSFLLGKLCYPFLTFLKWFFIFRGFFPSAHILRNMFKVNTSFLYHFFLPPSTVLRPVVLMEWRQFLDFENTLNLKINCVKRLQFKQLDSTCEYTSVPGVPRNSPKFGDLIGLTGLSTWLYSWLSVTTGRGYKAKSVWCEVRGKPDAGFLESSGRVTGHV